MNPDRLLVLCVDDDPDVLDYLEIVLESEGFEVELAGSAEEALACFERREPDVLLIDLMMEEVDAGTGLVKELRARGCEAPMFMLSSVGDALSTTIDTRALGLAGIFQKPLRKETFLTLLRAKLARR